MKRILFLMLSIASLAALAQETPVRDTVPRPAITAAGKSTGKAIENKMTKVGGTVISKDGKVELIFPAGAVTKNTTIRIEPVTNLLANGNGDAYRMEPAGIRFQQPVQLIFHYDEQGTPDSTRELMGIGMQDDKGQWFGLTNSTLDTAANTISGYIRHFSTWASFDNLKLVPMPEGKYRVKVNKSIQMYISGVTPGPPAPDDSELASLNTWVAPKKGIWRVNDIVKGNSTVGTMVAGVEVEEIMGMNVYTAPATVPNRNPVAISVDLVGASWVFKKGITMKNLKLVTNILVYDNAYEVKMISTVDGSAGSVFGTAIYKDTGSFVVSLNGKDTKIIEKVNKNSFASLDYQGQCTLKLLKDGPGSIHIGGNPVIKVTPPAAPGKYATVEMSFPRFPLLLPLIQYTCPDQKKGTITGTNAQANAMMASMVQAFPMQLKFEAKEEEQTILELGSAGSAVFVKITVKQLKDD